MTEMPLSDLVARVGEEIGVSDWLTVDQAMIDAFADTTGDRQFIHVDAVRAAATPFGGTIAHGFLILSLLPRLLDMADLPLVMGRKMAVNYGIDRLRFTAPVPAGGRIRARFTLAALTDKGGSRHEQALDVTVELDGSTRPALVVRWTNLLFL